MKSYQFIFKDTQTFTENLLNLKRECEKASYSEISFYISWIPALRDVVKNATDCIEEVFPEAIFYGNEASGGIIYGNLTYDIAVTCNIFEDKDTRTSMIWFEEGTNFWTLNDLWAYCKNENGLRAVELLPSINYNSKFELDNTIPDISEDILIFGGASVNYPDESKEACIIAKGHEMTEMGMVAVLYYGSNLHVSSNYILGWKGLGRYMPVTKSHDKILCEIGGMPSRKVFEKYLGLDEEDRSNLVFPLMVEEDGIEYIRSLVAFLPDDSMQMFVNIKEGLMTRIAYGDKNTILSSLLEKSSEIAEFKPQVLKSFSCAARRIFWGDDEIQKETVPLQELAPINGFYTGGEILRFGNKLRILNQTLVIIGFREGDGSNQEVKQITQHAKTDKSLLSRITYFSQVVANEQKAALDKAEEEKRRNDLLHNIINSGKWSFYVNKDDEMTGLDFSEEVKRIVNNDFSDTVESWTDVLHPDDKEAALKAFNATIADHTCNTPYDVTYRMMDRNGEYHWFHSAGRIVRDEEGNGEFFGIHINITDQIEEQIKGQKQLQDALIMADSANHAKTEFLFNMSHDIRTPMNAILGFTNMAIKHIDDKEKTIDCLGKIQKSGDLLLNLINNVLEVSRIESGKAVVEQQTGDVYYSFVNIESTMQIMAQSRDIDLTFEFGNIKDRYVYCDFTRCTRVFVNIISNAIKYTREGGYVRVKCEQIENDHVGYGLYRYTFEDNGFGMSEEFQEHVFEQFAREKTVTMTGIQGTGLGMAVCKSFVEIMHGTIECKSKLGEGTTFTVTLPFRIQDGEQYVDPFSKAVVDGSNTTKSVPKRFDFFGKRVLLAEDNELNREIAVELLEEAGMIVEEAEDGKVAVRLLKEKGPEYYDLILMDIQMPNMNGYEASKAIRAMYPDAPIPIVALSANAFSEDRTESMKAGMNAHVAKPIKVDELFTALSNL